MYPALVGAVGAAEILAAVFTVPLATAVPLFELKETVNALAIHVAVRVTLAPPTVYVELTA